MNKKGFTIVEIMASFLLISAVSILLLELFISLNQLYNKGEIQTRLLINQANFERRIMDDLNTSNIVTITSCGTDCVRFNLDGVIKELKILNKNLIYDNYALDNVKGSTMGSIIFNPVNTTLNDGTNATIYNIQVTIMNKIIKGDYGIHVVYQSAL